MADSQTIFLGKGERPRYLLAALANRHGLIAGATGTGKTATLRVMAEGFANIGVPVFAADVKGDLAGISYGGEAGARVLERSAAVGLSGFRPQAFPTVFWDLLGEAGHPVRTTVSEMGPLLLSRMLNLSEAQEGVLNIAFKFADDQGLLLLDFKDLRALLAHVAEHAKSLITAYGNIGSASVGTIQRQLLVLEQQRGEKFFGEPVLQLADLMGNDLSGRGVIHVLAADKLISSPRLYATFLLWLLSELFEQLPEVGDTEKPRLVFFFDEAHLLFDDAPKALLDKVEQVVRLVRSKSVGVYFVTQNPLDIPETILGQLGNRVQHALRAFTPRDQKAVRAAAQTFRANPKLDVESVITQLGVGEALVSVLDDKGIPTVVERCLIRPPESRMGPITPQERSAVMARSALQQKYSITTDRESAYEILSNRAIGAADQGQPDLPREETRRPRPAAPRTREGLVEAMAKSALRAIGSQVGRQIVRGV